MNETFLKNHPSGSEPGMYLKKGERCRNCLQEPGSLCEVLTCEELDRLDAIMSRVNYPQGWTLFTEGDDLDSYYTLNEGVARVIRLMPDGRRAVLDFLFPGDFLGLNSEGQYAYTVEAVTPVKLCAFPRTSLINMLSETPRLEARLLKILGNKLIASQHNQAALARKSPKERLAAFLLHLSKVAPNRTNENSFEIPMPREDISDHLGLTIETISRTFTSLSQDGLIEIRARKQIHLKNRARITALAQGL